MNRRRLAELIKSLREQMQRLAEAGVPLNSPEIIRLSRRIDELITLYHDPELSALNHDDDVS